MRVNPTYKVLVEKSVNSMISAIELYNKPDFKYREETFSILAVNAWELLLKAYILRENRYNMRALYVMVGKVRKDGTNSEKFKSPKLNRSGNPMTISVVEALKRVEDMGTLPIHVKNNIVLLVELRDTSIHFVNDCSLSKQIQELGFACIKNYMNIVSDWNVEINLDKYNLYLMPLAYISNRQVVDPVLTEEEERYVSFVKSVLLESEDNEDERYDVAIQIGLDFKKGNSFDAIGVRYASDGITVTLSEEDIKNRYPWTYSDLVGKCKGRYSNFKQNKIFYKIKNEVEKNEHLYHKRHLDPGNPKSPTKGFYSTNTLQVFDKHYLRK